MKDIRWLILCLLVIASWYSDPLLQQKIDAYELAIKLSMAQNVCRAHYFDKATFQGGRIECEVGYPLTDGMTQIMGVPVELAPQYELEAFNVREAKCRPPTESPIPWDVIHASNEVGDE